MYDYIANGNTHESEVHTGPSHPSAAHPAACTRSPGVLPGGGLLQDVRLGLGARVARQRQAPRAPLRAPARQLCARPVPRGGLRPRVQPAPERQEPALGPAFECVHEGTKHQLCFVSYLWPKDVFTREGDGVPLVTQYEFLARRTYEVLPISAVLYRAPLVRPPPLRPAPNARELYVLIEDIYESC